MKKTTKKDMGQEIKVQDYKPVVIKNDKDMLKATEFLSQLNKTLDGLVEEKEKLTKPLNEALKEIRGRYKPAESKLEDAIAQVRSEMGRYQTKLLREKREAEEKAALALASGDIDIEKAVKVVEKAGNRVVDKVVGVSGSVAFRTDKVLKIVDDQAVPREYLVVDEKRVREALLKGVAVAGCVLEEVQVPINRR